MLRGIVHYGLHLLAPYFLAFLWGRSRQFKAYLILLATMLVDLDHLLAQPIFDPNWWVRVVGVGLLFHMATDWQDFYLWQ